jgi:hypothetical protein
MLVLELVLRIKGKEDALTCLQIYSMMSIQYNLGNPTHMGPRYCWITENSGLLEKVGTDLLSCTAQHRSFGIDYHLTEFDIIYLFSIHKYVL